MDKVREDDKTGESHDCMWESGSCLCTCVLPVLPLSSMEWLWGKGGHSWWGYLEPTSFHFFGSKDLSLSPVPSGCWALCWMERIRSQESCVCTGAF